MLFPRSSRMCLTSLDYQILVMYHVRLFEVSKTKTVEIGTTFFLLQLKGFIGQGETSIRNLSNIMWMKTLYVDRYCKNL